MSEPTISGTIQLELHKEGYFRRVVKKPVVVVCDEYNWHDFVDASIGV